ncbi:MAG TPA: DNA ligase D, partial [Zeimonas sp.]|nr:DNA ligase D [Zeimonas sp.]
MRKRTDSLGEYRARRNFRRTPEPDGRTAGRGTRQRDSSAGRPAAEARLPAFVVQRHEARSLHWDFRLELDGVLKSWAVPKGPSADPATRRLAVQVEDHPLAYRDFEGTIPAGQYGAGAVSIWDEGRWESTEDPHVGLAQGKLHFALHGRRLRGQWTLVRTGAGPNWLLFKDRVRPARSPLGTRLGTPPGTPAGLPETLKPQLATAATRLPDDPDTWLYELKFDGYRVLMRRDGRATRLYTRSGLDWTDRFGSLAREMQRTALPEGWYDGEVVAQRPDGVPDFGALHAAMERGGTDDGRQLVYYLFDLPFCAGRDLRREPLERRRSELRRLVAANEGDQLRFSEAFEVTPDDLLANACRMGLEGLVAKRRDAPYVSARSRDWLKVKCREQEDFVIGGYTSPSGSRRGFRALMLGARDPAKKALRYVGNAGTGFDDATLERLSRRLQALKAERSPFADGPPATRTTHWTRPVLVARVAFGGWTRTGRLRHAVFQGLREDEPVGEAPTPTAGSRSLSHPDRVIDQQSGVTKGELAEYYVAVAPWIAAHLADRPTALLRAPRGIDARTFFQKHAGARASPPGIDSAALEGGARMLSISVPSGLLSAVQWNAIEFHTAGERVTAPGEPDRLTFDLDPGEGVTWRALAEAAELVRVLLTGLGLEPFLKTSGGNGLHVVVPLRRGHDWDGCKTFARTVAEHLARTIPERFVAVSGPRRRVGKVFVDHLRNRSGATTVSAWSARARPGIAVSVPLHWDELSPAGPPLRWTIRDVPKNRPDGNAPWAAYARARRSLAAAQRQLAAVTGRGGEAVPARATGSTPIRPRNN